jgi:hypothetical protein
MPVAMMDHVSILVVPITQLVTLIQLPVVMTVLAISHATVVPM